LGKLTINKQTDLNNMGNFYKKIEKINLKRIRYLNNWSFSKNKILKKILLKKIVKIIIQV
jgi:hypothetical protein